MDSLPTKREKGTLAKHKLWGRKLVLKKGTALSVLLREACVCKRDAPKRVRIRLWLPRRDDSSRVLIDAVGWWLYDWRRRNVGALIGQSVCRLLTLAREAIDSMCTLASGSLQSAATSTYLLRCGVSLF